VYIVVAGTIDLFVVEMRLTLRKVSLVLRHFSISDRKQKTQK